MSQFCKKSYFFVLGTSFPKMDQNLTSSITIASLFNTDSTLSTLNNIPFSNGTTFNPVTGNYSETPEFNVIRYMNPDLLHGYYMEDYVVISLYIPVILSALTANVIIIMVVFKDHYMRR